VKGPGRTTKTKPSKTKKDPREKAMICLNLFGKSNQFFFITFPLPCGH